MKYSKIKLVLSLCIFAIANVSKAQNRNVGIGTTTPDKSAILEIESENKGFLMPRMTLKKREAITTPAEGLIVYQTDENQGFYYYSGTTWLPISSNSLSSTESFDINGWALDGNTVSVAGQKSAATSSSYIGTPNNVPLNFKIGPQQAAKIDQMTRSTLIGYESGKNTTGNDNASIGYFALRANTTGVGNMAIGTYSLIKNIGGNYNVGIGTSSLQENLNGNNNIGMGIGSLRSVLGSGNVGIGVFSGFSSLGSNSIFIGNEAGRYETGSNKLYISNNNTMNPLIKGDFSENTLKVNSKSTGYLAVGDFDAGEPMPTPTGYRLIVQDGILTEKVKVAVKTTDDWADYVFEEDYKLLPLSEVEKFTKEFNHLPNVPSAQDMAEGGLDIGETSKMFMEKIEELTLYMIKLNKEVEQLKLENAELKASLNK